MTTQLAHLPAKFCTMCNMSKPRTEFSERWQSAGCKEKYRASNAYCKPCASKLAKLSSEKRGPTVNAAASRRVKLKSTYGLTIEDFDRMFNEQEGCCAICRTKEPGGISTRFHVDHCHHTGRVRGLLCMNCNRGIGALKDNADLLRKAISYLEKLL